MQGVKSPSSPRKIGPYSQYAAGPFFFVSNGLVDLDLHLHARVPCVSAFPEGETVALHVPGHLMHVFVNADAEPEFRVC